MAYHAARAQLGIVHVSAQERLMSQPTLCACARCNGDRNGSGSTCDATDLGDMGTDQDRRPRTMARRRRLLGVATRDRIRPNNPRVCESRHKLIEQTRAKKSDVAIRRVGRSHEALPVNALPRDDAEHALAKKSTAAQTSDIWRSFASARIDMKSVHMSHKC